MEIEKTRRIEFDSPANVGFQIEKAKNELESMIDLNPEVIMLLDKHGRIIRANKAALDFFQIQDFSLILYKELIKLLGKVSDKNLVEELLNRTEGYNSIEIDADSPASGPRTLKLSIVTSGTTGDSSVLIINDISHENRKAMDEEKRYKKEAVQALTGALMHNINQPLTVIMMRAQMIKKAIMENSIDPAEIRNGLDDVMNLSMRVASMIQAVEKPHDYITEPYIEGIEILDINKSAGETHQLTLTCSSMLNVLLETLNNRIPGTITHARRCGALSCRIAELAELDHRSCETARQAGFVHDLGKLAISDIITLKTSSLTDEEFKIMRTHAEYGYQIVRGLIFLEDEALAVRAHHEHYDGSGYPQGLSGAQIPAAARVVSLADAFEVMISGRPYREAISLQKTVAELQKCSGRQFDPYLTEIVTNNSVPLYHLLLSID